MGQVQAEESTRAMGGTGRGTQAGGRDSRARVAATTAAEAAAAATTSTRSTTTATGTSNRSRQLAQECQCHPECASKPSTLTKSSTKCYAGWRCAKVCPSNQWNRWSAHAATNSSPQCCADPTWTPNWTSTTTTTTPTPSTDLPSAGSCSADTPSVLRPTDSSVATGSFPSSRTSSVVKTT